MEEKYPLAQWLNDEANPQELEEIKASGDYVLLEKIKHYSAEIVAPPFDETRLYSQIISSKQEEKKVIPLQTHWLFKIAAVLLLVLGISYFYVSQKTQTEVAFNGSQTRFLLPDASEVVLNAGSEASYKDWNWDSHRDIMLKGEAFFKVAKGKKFQVHTNLGTVSVLGTQFNVKDRDNRFDVTCFEGRVQVVYKDQKVLITKNQSISFENGKIISTEAPKTTQPQWMSHALYFTQEKLTAVLQEMERQYNVSITHDIIQEKQLFTGELPANNLEASLQIISSIYHLQSTKLDQNTYHLDLVNVSK